MLIIVPLPCVVDRGWHELSASCSMRLGSACSNTYSMLAGIDGAAGMWRRPSKRISPWSLDQACATMLLAIVASRAPLLLVRPRPIGFWALIGHMALLPPSPISASLR
jgi:hypothetical protein